MTVEINGIDDVKKLLDSILPRHANNIMRAVVHGVAGEAAKIAKSIVPVDTGDLRGAIKTKRGKSEPSKPVSYVYIQQGKGKKPDGFYWRFVEYGTGGGDGSHIAKSVQSNAQPFLRPAADQINANLEAVMVDQFGKKLDKTLARLAKKRLKS